MESHIEFLYLKLKAVIDETRLFYFWGESSLCFFCTKNSENYIQRENFCFGECKVWKKNARSCWEAKWWIVADLCHACGGSLVSFEHLSSSRRNINYDSYLPKVESTDFLSLIVLHRGPYEQDVANQLSECKI